jgi:hypothetical protein
MAEEYRVLRCVIAPGGKGSEGVPVATRSSVSWRLSVRGRWDVFVLRLVDRLGSCGYVWRETEAETDGDADADVVTLTARAHGTAFELRVASQGAGQVCVTLTEVGH